MRRRLAALAFAATIAWGAAAGAAEPVYPRGANAGLVPPPGMQESQTFSGFEDREALASILVAEMPAEAQSQLELGFTNAALASKGITVTSREDVTLADNITGVLVRGTQSAGTVTLRKWILLAGNGHLAAIATAQVPDTRADTYSDQVMEGALRSIAFRSMDAQLEALPYAITQMSDFRVVRTIGGTSALLTLGPKDVVDAAEQPYFVVTIASGAPRDEERGPFARRAISTVPGIKELRVERAEPLRIGNQAGYEIIGTARDARTGDEVKVIQWLRFGPNAHMRMIVVAKTDTYADVYPRVRAIRDGIEPR